MGLMFYRHPNLCIRRCGSAPVDRKWAEEPLRTWFWRLYWFSEAEVEFDWPDRSPEIVDRSKTVLVPPGHLFKRRVVASGAHLFIHFIVEGFTGAFWRKFLEGYEINSLDHIEEDGLEALYEYVRKAKSETFTAELQALSIVAGLLHHSVKRAGGQRQSMLDMAVQGDARLAVALALARSTEGCATVADLARASAYSCDHFSRRFKECFMVSPSVFLAELRLQKSINQLINSTASIEDIAEDCGFNDRSYFTRCFSAWTGVGPSTYRKIHIKSLRSFGNRGYAAQND